MYLIKVVRDGAIEGEETVGLYSTQFIQIEANLVTVVRHGSQFELENPTTMVIPDKGKAYIMDAEGNTLDTYYP